MRGDGRLHDRPAHARHAAQRDAFDASARRKACSTGVYLRVLVLEAIEREGTGEERERGC